MMHRDFPSMVLSRGFLAAALIACPALIRASPGEDAPATRPALEALNHETKSLYQQVQTGLVRVQLPMPLWRKYAVTGIKNWNQLDPAVRHTLEQQAAAQTQPATRPTDEAPPGYHARGTYIFVRPGSPADETQREAFVGGRLAPELNTPINFAPNNIGILLDSAGHVLVPMYIEKEAVGDQPIRVAGPEGHVAEARFVGSDRQTMLTLLQVDKPTGKPVALGEERPEPGSLVLYVSPTDGSGRLGMWTGGGTDFGLVATIDGNVAGVARYGQFLSGKACRLIASEIAHYGAVKRATLGVIISEVRKDDPQRQLVAVLGERSAVRIDEVMTGSAADRAGLKPGDLVLALSGEAVSDIPSFAAAIASRSGETDLQVLRGDQVCKVTVYLQKK